jgi:hypothetical protein
MNRRRFFGLVASGVVAAAVTTRLGQVALTWATKPGVVMVLSDGLGNELGRAEAVRLDDIDNFRAEFGMPDANGRIENVVVLDADQGVVTHLNECYGTKTNTQEWQVTVPA